MKALSSHEKARGTLTTLLLRGRRLIWRGYLTPTLRHSWKRHNYGDHIKISACQTFGLGWGLDKSPEEVIAMKEQSGKVSISSFELNTSVKLNPSWSCSVCLPFFPPIPAPWWPLGRVIYKCMWNRIVPDIKSLLRRINPRSRPKGEGIHVTLRR